jgi:signal transduction histidine kinase
MENNYLVVTGDNQEYVGILTPSDLAVRPHNLVIDCLTNKEKLQSKDEILFSLEKFNHCDSPALPVFEEDIFCGVVEKKSILKEVSEKIDDLYRQSLISINLRDAFLNNLSHEIRTPLNVILGFLEILKQDCNEKPGFNKYYTEIKKQSVKFICLINDLVELSLIQSRDAIVLHCSECMVEDIFLSITDTFKESCEKKNLSIKYVNPDPFLVLYTDYDKLTRILFHLVDNAVKFSEKGNIIFGYSFVNQDSINFFVKNSGSVIPEEIKDKIFESFEKIMDYQGRIYPGLGIGLSLSGKYVELMGGKINFESNPAKGTTFNFTLPVLLSAPKPAK